MTADQRLIRLKMENYGIRQSEVARELGKPNSFISLALGNKCCNGDDIKAVGEAVDEIIRRKKEKHMTDEDFRNYVAKHSERLTIEQIALRCNRKPKEVMQVYSEYVKTKRGD